MKKIEKVFLLQALPVLLEVIFLKKAKTLDLKFMLYLEKKTKQI